VKRRSKNHERCFIRIHSEIRGGGKKREKKYPNPSISGKAGRKGGGGRGTIPFLRHQPTRRCTTNRGKREKGKGAVASPPEGEKEKEEPKDPRGVLARSLSTSLGGEEGKGADVDSR